MVSVHLLTGRIFEDIRSCTPQARVVRVLLSSLPGEFSQRGPSKQSGTTAWYDKASLTRPSRRVGRPLVCASEHLGVVREICIF